MIRSISSSAYFASFFWAATEAFFVFFVSRSPRMMMFSSLSWVAGPVSRSR
jgi:hypothetical protein